MAIKRQAAAPAKSAANTGRRTPPPAGNGHGGEEGAVQSKAAAFDSAKPQGAVDSGKYDAVIVEMVMGKEDPEKGQSARVKIEIATEGDMQGESATQFYKVFETDGSVGKGAAYLKRDLAILGYGDVRFGDLEEVFEEITDKHPGVAVTVKQNGQFTNVYINALSEDSEVIENYLATRGPF